MSIHQHMPQKGIVSFVYTYLCKSMCFIYGNNKLCGFLDMKYMQNMYQIPNIPDVSINTCISTSASIPVKVYGIYILFIRKIQDRSNFFHSKPGKQTQTHQETSWFSMKTTTEQRILISIYVSALAWNLLLIVFFKISSTINKAKIHL